MIRSPSLTHRQISHLTVEHGQCYGCVLNEKLQKFLALSNRNLRKLALSNVFREDNDPADLSVAGKPGTKLPLHPLQAAVRSVQHSFTGMDRLAGVGTAMIILPCVWN